MRFSHILKTARRSKVVTKNRVSTIHDPRYFKLINVLIKHRTRNKISQSKLASQLGIPQPDVSKVERFVRRIDALEFFDWINAIAVVSKTEPAEILNDIHVDTFRPQRSKNNT